MTLYHGSKDIVEYPEIRKARFNKDFYFGFYCTNIEKQAERWATRYGEKGYINRYEYTENTELKILRFEKMTEEWLDFIISCRSGQAHQYDIVEGPMADDTIYNYPVSYTHLDVYKRQVLDSLTDYEKARDGIEEFLKKPFFIENEKVSFHAAICGIMNAEKLEKEDSILSYIEYMISLIQNRQDTVLIQSDSKILEGFRYEQELSLIHISWYIVLASVSTLANRTKNSSRRSSAHWQPVMELPCRRRNCF